VSKSKVDRRQKIKYKIAKKVRGTAEKPRLAVFRSLKHVYTQLIDDVNSVTLLSVNSNSKEISDKLADSKGKISVSKIVGQLTAEKAKTKNIKSIVFDRSGYLYHGRVKAIAEGAREGGLKF
jgi:large subunit ribosomal protein L18